MSNDKYYNERAKWFKKYLAAKKAKNESARTQAFNKLIELTDGRFNGQDPNK